MAVHVTGALICSQTYCPRFDMGWCQDRHAALSGAYPPQSVYGIGQLAMAWLGTTLASELGQGDISVNGIAPGNTISDAGKAYAEGWVVPPKA